MGQKCRNSGQNATHSAIPTRKKRASARPPLDCTKPWIPMRLADFCSLKVSDIDSDRRWGKPEPDQMLKHRPDTTRAASKTVVRVSVPWVRIPPPPPPRLLFPEMPETSRETPRFCGLWPVAC